MEAWELIQKQSLPFKQKVILAEDRIRDWYETNDGNVYVSFSGGKDSTVLLDLVRNLYPDVTAMFCDTGLEYPEIRSFVKTFQNVDTVRPNKTFKEVIDKYGYPVVSKKVSAIVDRYNNTKDPEQKRIRKYGGAYDSEGNERTTMAIPKKWRFLMDAPFKISDRCCYWLKKKPSLTYTKKSGKKPYIGFMASDSELRKSIVIKYGCNSFEEDMPRSLPLAYWNEKDIWDYIKTKELQYSSIYDTGCDRTGCMFCMFGVHMESPPNRFQLMAKTHPKQYNHCINTLGCGRVMDYIGIDYKPLNTLKNYGA